MLRVVLATWLVLAAVAAGGAEATPRGSQLLAFVSGTLVRVDPASLQPLPGRSVRVGDGGCAGRQGGIACWRDPTWTLSPDEQRLAVARNIDASLQLVDVTQLRTVGTIRVGGGSIGALAWLEPRRLLAIQELNGERQRVLTVDVTRRRVVSRRALGGSVEALARTPNELVLLLAPPNAIGRARLAVVDARGAVRFVRLDQILAGSKLLGTGSEHAVDSRLPGLAVDPGGRRAFVVDSITIAEIDLSSLSVAYHALARQAPILKAVAKQVSGYARQARWLGGGTLAVSGSDTDTSRIRAAGLLLVDTSDWTVRVLDSGATSFDVAGDILLAMGGGWDAAAERMTGIGLAAYAFDGTRRFRLLDGELAWVARSYGGRAYVGISGQETLRIVDLATGRVLGTREQPLPWLLLGAGDGWWGG